MSDKPTFTRYFCDEYLKNYFQEKLLSKNGGGRDHLSPVIYWQKNENNTDFIVQKCSNGTYVFSAYNELLILKGRNKYPRVISIPTVRDRLVLGALNEYLQNMFPECVNHHVPNFYISKINHYLKEHQGKKIKFLKTDFSAFYDNINQQLLIRKLKKKINNELILRLIEKAIQTPTIGEKTTKWEINRQGVPQGLAISNILAAIYMEQFDKDFEHLSAGLYIRYVDDILFLQPHFDQLPQIVKQYIEEEEMNLTLTKEKTHAGIIGETDLEYIGYLIRNKHITIRKKNINNFINRLAGKCTKFRKEYKDKLLRPRFLENDEDFTSFFIEELNMTISGIKVDSHLYGWLPYFQQINDISLLYKLDKILKKLLNGLDLSLLPRIHSFVDSFYAIKERGGGSLIFNYDKIDTFEKKRVYLKKKGLLDNHRLYDEQQIDLLFKQHRQFVKKNMEQNIGYFI